jgi:hypothetical protein
MWVGGGGTAAGRGAAAAGSVASRARMTAYGNIVVVVSARMLSPIPQYAWGPYRCDA